MFGRRTILINLQAKRYLFRRTESPKVVTVDDAAKVVKSYDRIYMHGCAAFPLKLAEALAKRHGELEGVEVNHLHIEHENPLSKVALKQKLSNKTPSFHVANYFIGAKERRYVSEGSSDLIPCFLSDLPGLMRLGYRRPNIAMVQVSPPDRHGFCSLGIEVCTAYAACETSDLIIALVNPKVPRTSGQSFIHYNCIDYVVEIDEPLPASNISHASAEDSVEARIGRNVANLVQNGACLQVGIGAIPNAVLQCLGNHKNLGLHTEMFSDGVISLFKRGIITNMNKSVMRGYGVTTFVAGTQELYDFVDGNPEIHFLDVATVNDPRVIGRNEKVTAINSAIEVDITGQVCADSVGTRMISGVGGQVDFERGAAISHQGLPMICLPSTTSDGTSRIVPILKPGAGVITSRNHVYWIVTEFGAVNLHGLTMAERAKAIISVAHPDHRESLTKSAHERYLSRQ